MFYSTATATGTPSSLFLRNVVTPSLLLLRRSNLSVLISGNPNKHLCLSASLADTHTHLSWSSPPPPTDDDHFKGWAFPESLPQNSNKKKGLPNIVIIAGIGTCVATLLAAIAYALHSRKETDEKLERVKVSVDVDSNQLESLFMLKKLKSMEIIEINGYHEEEAREALISANRRSGAYDQPDAATIRSQLQPDVSLVRENEALRSELMNMKLYVSNMQKNQVSSTKGIAAAAPMATGSRKHTIFSSMSKTLGKLNPFKHRSEDTFHIDDNIGVDNTKPRRRRFSIS